MCCNFNKAFEEVIGIEGGYVNDPTDRGGETKYGISKRSYPNVDIKNLTLAQAKKIYCDDYWRPLGLESISEYKIAHELFDTAVNMGVSIAKKMLQEALNLMNRNGTNYADLTVDGVIGTNTINAYNKVDKMILLKVLNGLQFMRYVEIVKRNPSQERFFNGWMLRI